MADRRLFHLLSLADLSADALTALLDRAERYLRGDAPPMVLAGKRVANLFFEDSTRTRHSFAVAARRLGGETLDFTAAGSSTNKGESLLDTVRTILAIGADLIVVRHSASGAPALLAREIDRPIVSAGDGRHAHPTQGLLDLLTLRQRWGRFAGKHVLIVGDVANSRVARCSSAGLRALGASVTFVGPANLCPASLSALGSPVTHDFDAAIPTADAVMMLRIQTERISGGAFPSLREYVAGYQLNEERLRRAKPDVLILHPGPVNRGVELSPAVADGPQAVILDQVRAGVAARMAVLERMQNAE
ncbi:MAG: aspartate carbamoyltransferase catalytic subunit [Phycisphaerae bacterium]|nr:aspartate carbamoyltransferase catalytic subunit [Phycisphaerae bacterium]